MMPHAREHFVERANEAGLIETAIHNQAHRTIIVQGAAGSGKSTLLAHVLTRQAATGALVGIVNHVRDPAAPAESLIRALEAMVSAGLDLLYEPDSALSGLSSLLGSSAEVLADVGEGPFRRLKRYIGAGAPLEADAAEIRLADTILRVLLWLDGFHKPVILALEDWGRADAATVRLYQRICSDRRLHMLRILASERIEEAMPEAEGLRIFVPDFSQDELRRFVLAKLANVDVDHNAIAETLFGIGANNPLRAEQYLRLEGTPSNLSQLDRTALVVARLKATAGLDVLADSRIQTRSARTIATALALLEGPLAESEFKLLCSPCPDYEQSIEALARVGVIVRGIDGIRMAHDTIRENALGRMTLEERAARSAELSEALRRAASDPASPRGQLMLRLRVAGGVSNIEPSVWQRPFYIGAAAARRRGERRLSHQFASIAVKLAIARGDTDDDTLAEATLSAAEQGRFEEAVGYAQLMQQGAKTDYQNARASELMVYAARVSGDLQRASDAARAGLANVGVSPPQHPLSLTALMAIARAVFASPAAAHNAPGLTDAELTLHSPMIRAIHSLATLLFERDPMLATAFLACSVTPRIAGGTSAGAAAYGVICANFGLHRKALAWSEISALRQSSQQPLRAAAMLYAINIGPRLAKGRIDLDQPRAKVIDLAISEGELSVALYATRDRALDALLGQTPLAEIRALITDGLSTAAIRDPGIRSTFSALLDTLELLSSNTSGMSTRRHAVEFVGFASQTGRIVATLDALIALAFGDYGALIALYNTHMRLFARALHQDNSATWSFIVALGHLLCDLEPPRQYCKVLSRLARTNPENHLHRQLALLALKELRRGHNDQALAMFSRAVDCASHSWIEQGLILRAYADAARRTGHPTLSDELIERARHVFDKLGAHAVTQQLTSSTNAKSPAADAKACLAEASRAATAKGRLLAAISHELRAPLQGAKAVLELGDLQKTEARLALASVIDQLSVAIDDLHQLSVADVDALKVTLRPFDSKAMLAELVALWLPLTPAPRRLVLSAVEAPLLSGDSTRLRQAIGNLISNAIKYGKGDITISASAEVLGNDAWRYQVFVDDEGAPLSEGDWARLFEPFKRGQVEGVADGLGLGLSIARRIARVLGGDISASRSPSGGTRFCLSVTCCSNTSSSTHAPALVGDRVLLVEDEPITRRALAELLARQGLDVTAVGTAEEAHTYLEQRFQLILLDENLPDARGSAIAERARANAPNTTIAIVSGEPSEELRRKASSLGAVLMSKPIGLHDLLLLLSRSGPPLAEHRAEAADEICAMLDDLLEAERLHDHQQVAFLAHKISGLGAQFGFVEVQESARRLECEDISDRSSALTKLRSAASQLGINSP